MDNKSDLTKREILELSWYSIGAGIGVYLTLVTDGWISVLCFIGTVFLFKTIVDFY